jgi:hypothetical protein
MSIPFDATASMLGYLFQCRLALVDSIPRLRYQGSFKISIETLEDVAFETSGQPLELLQTKHHAGTSSGLGDSSADLWKTLRIWSDGLREGRWPDDTIHYLATTATAQPASIAWMLRKPARDPQRARDRLDQVARTSTNRENQALYAAYLKLSQEERLSLLQRVIVLDRMPTIDAVEQQLREELTITVRREHLEAFVSRLEGWWFQRVVNHLRRTPPDDVIRSEELDAAIDRLRDQFHPDNLPIDEELIQVDIDEAAYLNNVFVAQLKLLGLAGKRVLNAMRQYYSASEQRSRWLREGILRFGELQTYDRRLHQEWDILFTAMWDDLGQTATEEEMVKAARILYKWAEQDAAFLIRPSCDEPFICRGSLQMLADSRKIGWHPQFLERLKDVVREAS